MPRLPRLDAPGVLHHVMGRGIEKKDIFINSKDRNDFINRLAQLAEEGAIEVYAWALMPNHFHLLLKTKNRLLIIRDARAERAQNSLIMISMQSQNECHLWQDSYSIYPMDKCDVKYASAALRGATYLLAIINQNNYWHCEAGLSRHKGL